MNRIATKAFAISETKEKEIEKRHKSIEKKHETSPHEVRYKSGAEIASCVHKETKEHVISEYGWTMDCEHIERIKSEETGKKVNVLSSSEYTERFPNISIGVLGHCDMEGNIFIKDISLDHVEHITTHETVHLCANREISNTANIRKEISGLRESYIPRYGEALSFNSGVNEGLTEMYTLRELNRRGSSDAAEIVSAYSEERMWAERMEAVIGCETVASAYFGGETELLIDEFNRLNGNDVDAWGNFSRDVEILHSGNEYGSEEIDNARERLARQFFTMEINRNKMEDNNEH